MTSGAYEGHERALCWVRKRIGDGDVVRGRSARIPATRSRDALADLRSPRRGLIALQNSLSEVTGPVFGPAAAEADARDRVLDPIEQPARRKTLITRRQARESGDSYVLDIHPPDENEAVFCDVRCAATE